MPSLRRLAKWSRPLSKRNARSAEPPRDTAKSTHIWPFYSRGVAQSQCVSRGSADLRQCQMMEAEAKQREVCQDDLIPLQSVRWTPGPLFLLPAEHWVEWGITIVSGHRYGADDNATQYRETLNFHRKRLRFKLYNSRLVIQKGKRTRFIQYILTPFWGSIRIKTLIHDAIHHTFSFLPAEGITAVRSDRFSNSRGGIWLISKAIPVLSW